NDLIREIVQSHSVNDNVKAEIKSEYNKIGLNSIVPLGLIINELLSNSFKHAFSNGKSGAINVEISGGPGNTFYLKYSDTGIWIDEDREGNSFGLDLIATLTEQLEGSFTRSGSSYHFTFNNQDSNT
ncbi:MAG TPA: sensor histidine kinase, partial [Flavobacteriales bacterium]|nr:sensor histidine kinase [Flavobacteriales bacterium]